MRTIEQHPFYLTNNKGILEAHASEGEYQLHVKSLVQQLCELFWG